MRLVTWNCRRGLLAKKRTALDARDADIVVLTEASRPTSDSSGSIWFGEARFGVAVFAKPPFTLGRIAPRSVPCIYPVSVSGPESFTLFAVWTWAAPTYYSAFMAGLNAYADLPKPWVIAGDFNGNVCFDRPRAKNKWSDCFARLESEGLVSAYHTPRDWQKRLLDVNVAPYDELASLSDHRPLSITVRTT